MYPVKYKLNKGKYIIFGEWVIVPMFYRTFKRSDRMFDKIFESRINFVVFIMLFFIGSIYIMGGIPWLLYFVHQKVFFAMIFAGFGMGTLGFLASLSEGEGSILWGIFSWMLYGLGGSMLGLSLIFCLVDFIKIASWFGIK